MVCFDLGDTLIAEESAPAKLLLLVPLRGVPEVLKAIKGDGYKVAIIANGDSNSCHNIINATGLQDYFDAIIISEEAGAEKPCQEILKIALAKLASRLKMQSWLVTGLTQMLLEQIELA